MLKANKESFLNLKWLMISILFCLSSASQVALSASPDKKDKPLATNGVIDLSQWNFEKDGPVDLRGEWRFAWQQFVEPKPVAELFEQNKEIVNVPGYWGNITNPEKIWENLPNTGYASYILEVKLNENQARNIHKLGINGGEFLSSANLQVWDAASTVMLTEVKQGKPAKVQSDHIPVRTSTVRPFSNIQTTSLLIVVHVSNYNNYWSGSWILPQIGSYKDLYENSFWSFSTSLFLVGALVLISIYHLVIFVQRPEDVSSLLFFIFCATISLRETLMGRLFEQLGIGVSLDGFVTLLKVEYLTIPVLIVAVSFFVFSMSPGKKLMTITKWWSLGFGIFLLGFTTFSPSITFTENLMFYQVYMMVTGVLLVIHLIIKTFKNTQEQNIAKWIGLSFVVLLLGTINDILHSQGVIVTGYYGPLTFIGFILMQSGIISGKSAYAYKQTKLLSANLQEKNKEITFFNQNLERLVDDKTREIKGLLDHIPQGVLTIESEGLIGKNFSAHLSEVLGNSDVAEKSFKEAILDKSSLTLDDQDQAWQAIINSVNLDELGFILNSGKLPHEIEYTHDSTTKILESTWNPQVKDGMVESILVTLLDVTAEKKLEAEAKQQQKEMAKISELVAVPEAKAHNFFSTSYVLLEEIKNNIGKGADYLDQERIKMLFVNAHTVKGSARTLNFSELTELIHVMEHRYSQILREEEDVDVDAMQNDINAVLRMFEEYSKVNTEKLNRSSSDHFINIDRNLIEKTFYMMKDFVTGGKDSKEDFLPVFDKQSDLLAKLIFENLPQVFDDYRERVIKIAADTGREKPELNFSIPDTIISADQREVLDMAMIHLLRNALDHGIENKDDREAKGKSAHGILEIKVETKDDVLSMEMKDDGKGLPINMLRDKGTKSGQLTAESSLQEVAQIIFTSGVSTAESVTDISGRGVGMDAVRQFMERAGGSIDIIVGEEKPERGFYNFHFKVTLPLSQIIIDKKSGDQDSDLSVA